MTSFQKLIKYFAVALAAVIIAGVVGGISFGISLLSGVVSGDDDGSAEEVNAEMISYPVTGDVTSVRVDVTAARLDIRAGDAVALESTLTDLSVKNDGGCLTVKDERHILSGADSNSHSVSLTLSRDTVLDELEIDGGAGSVSVDGLTVGRLSTDLGAGSTRLSALTVTDKADIDGGAGILTIDGCDLANLDLDLGTGRAEIDCRLSGDCEIDQGVGALDLTLRGSLDDYRIVLDKGLGLARLGGSAVGSGTYGSGSCTVDIDGGVGAIMIDIADAASAATDIAGAAETSDIVGEA